MRSILFSDEMVRAEREGRKTVTRRIAKPRKQPSLLNGEWSDSYVLDRGNHKWLMRDCPYGDTGERLWVRETHYRFGHWEPVEGARTKEGREKWHFVGDDGGLGPFKIPKALYDGEIKEGEFRRSMSKLEPKIPAWHRRLARFMPRRLARTVLEVVGIRLERLQDITEEDAIAEGIERGKDFFRCPMWKNYLPDSEGASWFPDDPIGSYRTLWESINGPGSWDVNPLVWRIEFRRVEA